MQGRWLPAGSPMRWSRLYGPQVTHSSLQTGSTLRSQRRPYANETLARLPPREVSPDGRFEGRRRFASGRTGARPRSPRPTRPARRRRPRRRRGSDCGNQGRARAPRKRRRGAGRGPRLPPAPQGARAGRDPAGRPGPRRRRPGAASRWCQGGPEPGGAPGAKGPEEAALGAAARPRRPRRRRLPQRKRPLSRRRSHALWGPRCPGEAGDTGGASRALRRPPLG